MSSQNSITIPAPLLGSSSKRSKDGNKLLGLLCPRDAVFPIDGKVGHPRNPLLAPGIPHFTVDHGPAGAAVGKPRTSGGPVQSGIDGSLDEHVGQSDVLLVLKVGGKELLDERRLAVAAVLLGKLHEAVRVACVARAAAEGEGDVVGQADPAHVLMHGRSPVGAEPARVVLALVHRSLRGVRVQLVGVPFYRELVVGAMELRDGRLEALVPHVAPGADHIYFHNSIPPVLLILMLTLGCDRRDVPETMSILNSTIFFFVGNRYLGFASNCMLSSRIYVEVVADKCFKLRIPSDAPPMKVTIAKKRKLLNNILPPSLS